MALPEVGLAAVIENLREFQQGAESIIQAYDEINEETVEVAKTSAGASQALDAVGNVAGAVATGGMTLLVTAVAAVATAIVALSTAGVAWAAEFDASMGKVQARTGATEEELEGLETTAQNIFQLGLGENFEEVALAMAQVEQTTGLAGEELESLTTDALTLSNVFDKDVGESVRAVDQAMIAFGSDSEQVMDLVTTSIQQTGDPADDLLDTINEYSINFAEAGFTAEEMFGVLEAGLEAGAFNFDKVGDVVREFFIRLKDGSDTTAQALNDLFAVPGDAVSVLTTQIDALNLEIGDQEEALKDTKEAMESAKGAWGASKQIVSDLQAALNEARMELEEMARPKLAGLEEFDDRIFSLEQRSKRARLALLDLEEGTPEFEAARDELDALNKELERARLAKEIRFDEQFRALEKAAEAGIEPVVSLDDALAQIALKKGEIQGIEVALLDAEAAAAGDAAEVERLEAIYTGLVLAISNNKDQVALLATELEAADTPAKQFLEDLSTGAVTGPEAMSKIIQALQDVEDPLKRNQIGVSLFGSMWEDLGESVILAMDPAELALADVEGATDKAREAASGGLGPAFERLKRTLKVSVAEGFEPVLAAIVNNIVPAFETFAEWLQGPGKSVLEEFGQFLSDNIGPLLENLGPILEEKVIPALTDFANWLKDEGIPAVQEFINWVVETGIPKLQEFADWFKEEALPVLIAVGAWLQEEGIPAFNDFLKFVSQFISSFIAGWNKLKQIWEVVKIVFRRVWSFPQKIMKKLGSFIKKTTKDISKKWDETWTKAEKIIKDVWDFINEKVLEVLKKIWAKIEETWNDIRREIEDAMNSVKETVDSVWKEIEKFITDTVTAIQSKVEEVWNDIKTFVEDTVSDIETAVEDAWANIESKIEETIGNILSAIENVWGDIKDAISDALSAIEKKVGEVWDGIKTKISEKHGEIETDVTTKWDSIKTSISDALSSIVKTVGEKFGEVKEKTAGKLGETADLMAPGSTLYNRFVSVGSNIMNGILSGIDSVRDFVSRIVGKVSSAVSDLLTSVTSGTIATTLSSIGSNIANKIVAGFQSVTDFASRIIDKIASWLNWVKNWGFDMLNAAKDIGARILDKILGGFGDLKKTFTDFFEDKLDEWLGWVKFFATDMLNAAKEVGAKILNQILAGFGGLKDDFINWVKSKLTEWLGDIFSPIAEAQMVGAELAAQIMAGFAMQRSAFIRGLRGQIGAWVSEVPAIPFTANLQPVAAPATIAAPVLGAGGGTTINNTFQFGGNTITSGMDEAAFDARVMRAIRRAIP